MLPLNIETGGGTSRGMMFNYATWTRAGGLVMVYNNDIYYKPSVDAKVERITNDGVPGVVFNGVTDWIYRGITFIVIVNMVV